MKIEYRAFHTRISFVLDGETFSEDLFDIREVYYGETGKIEMVSAEGIHPAGDTMADLVADLANMLNAVRTKPALTPKDVPGYEYDEGEVSP